jgi:hypothetical protein
MDAWLGAGRLRHPTLGRKPDRRGGPGSLQGPDRPVRFVSDVPRTLSPHDDKVQKRRFREWALRELGLEGFGPRSVPATGVTHLRQA